MIQSGELFQYTAKTLERIGYKVYTLDFKTPLKSSKYNFLQPVIEAINNNDMPKAVNYCSDIVESLVGEVGNREAIWINGEKSVEKAGIMAVVTENTENKQYQNLPNVYNFIAEMCKEQDDKTMLMDTFLTTLPDSHPAVASFAAARIAPSKTRASFFTSALATLSIFIDKLRNIVYNIFERRIIYMNWKRKVKCITSYVEDCDEFWTEGNEYGAKHKRDGNWEIETNFGSIGCVGSGYMLDNFDEYFEIIK